MATAIDRIKLKIILTIAVFALILISLNNISFLYFAIYITVPIVLTIVIAVALTRGEFIKCTKAGFGVNTG